MVHFRVLISIVLMTSMVLSIAPVGQPTAAQSVEAAAVSNPSFSISPLRSGGQAPVSRGQDDLMAAFREATSGAIEAREDGYRAQTGGLAFTLDEGGLKAEGWGMTLLGMGRGGAMALLPIKETQQRDGWLEYQRGGLSEWYRSTGMGLEQGFTVREAPAGTGDLTLWFALAGGQVAAVDGDGRGLSFDMGDGRVLRYDQLKAWDALGKELEAALRLEDGRVALAVKDEMAVYPITIDPLIYMEQKVVASSNDGGCFGWSVALSTDGSTALIGADMDDVGTQTAQGSAYVFVQNGSGWKLQQRLTASDGETFDQFGYAVALSEDGSMALVSAVYDEFATATPQGSVYVFTRDSYGIWSQQQQLTASDGAANDEFGWSVALSADGARALVSAPHDDVGTITDQGSVYYFENTGFGLQEKQIINEGAGQVSNLFGASVAISGDGSRAVIGIPGYPKIGFYSRTGSTWALQTNFYAGGSSGDLLGWSVALSTDGQVAVIGVPQDDVGVNSDQGSVYVRNFSGGSSQLLASDGAQNDHFGRSVAISSDGSTVLIGATGDNTGSGSAYIFTNDGAAWNQRKKLDAPDGAPVDYFGTAVALAGNSALVGAYSDDNGTNISQGTASFFTGSGALWDFQQQITSSDGAAEDQFGQAVAISGDGNTALIAAPYADIDTYINQGAVYVFTRNSDLISSYGSSWIFQDKLVATDGINSDHFGNSVALSSDGNTALVGAMNDTIGSNSGQGSAYVFTRSGTTWSLEEKITASDGGTKYYFGRTVTLSSDGNTALVGSYNSDSGHDDHGSAYVFTRSGTNWSQQWKFSAENSGDFFGSALALSNDGNTALVGAHGVDVDSKLEQGAAYIYTRSGATWSLQQKVTAIYGAAFDRFSSDVALSGDGNTALIGVSGDDVNLNSNQGSARIFTRSGTTWSEQTQMLTANDGAVNDCYGRAVDLSEDGTTALIGSFSIIVDLMTVGSTYILTYDGSSWTQKTRLVASDRSSGDRFGYDVAISADGQTYLIGAYEDAIGTVTLQGSAYFYDALPEVKSLTRRNRNPSMAASVQFNLVFNENVTGVDSSDFSLTTTGSLSGAAITGVSGSGTTYTVTVSTGSGDGTIRLDIGSEANMIDAGGNPLNGRPYVSGEVYTLDRTAPDISSILRADGNPAGEGSVHFTVTFTEAMTRVDASDFTLTTTGVNGAAITDVSGSGAVYTVTVSTGTGVGTIRLDLASGAVVTDLAGNALTHKPYTNGEVYTIAIGIFLPLVLLNVQN